MDKVSAKLTVFFEDPFWVGIFEQTCEGKLSAARVVFGAEPRDFVVYELILQQYYRLRFSPAVEGDATKETRSPKRAQREAKRQLEVVGVGTKSQQALKLLQEQCKIQRKTQSKAMREEEKQRKFEQKQQKRKEKNRGR